MQPTRDQVFDFLTGVHDPEIPVLDVVEMGIVRDVRFEGETLHVDITPTYSGCPAMRTIADEIERVLRERGIERVAVHTVFDAAWSTDWMTDTAREKLRAYGIAPPERSAPADWMPFATADRPVPCPFCGSDDTTLTSPFGATACKALRFCNACRQPFEHFKCH